MLFSPGTFFSNTADVSASAIIFADDEGVGQELLFEQTITDIEVDGSNNKWIATASSGVFYLSANGQQPCCDLLQRTLHCLQIIFKILPSTLYWGSFFCYHQWVGFLQRNFHCAKRHSRKCFCISKSVRPQYQWKMLP